MTRPPPTPAGGWCAGCASRFTSMSPLAARTLWEWVSGGTSTVARVLRPGRIAHVHDAGAVRRLHVGDVGDGAVDRHLAAARAVEPGDLLESAGARGDGRHVGRSLADDAGAAKPLRAPI